jgi:hypothetical protein
MMERNDSEDLGVDGRVILNSIFKKWNEGMGWIDLAYDRDRWRTLVSALVNPGVIKNARKFLTG